MTPKQAADILRLFASSGWAKRMLGEKQMQAIRLGAWALDEVAKALETDKKTG